VRRFAAADVAVLLLVSGSEHHACASACVIPLASTCERLPLSYMRITL
jgi:hypothetical protein